MAKIKIYILGWIEDQTNNAHIFEHFFYDGISSPLETAVEDVDTAQGLLPGNITFLGTNLQETIIPPSAEFSPMIAGTKDSCLNSFI